MAWWAICSRSCPNWRAACDAARVTSCAPRPGAFAGHSNNQRGFEARVRSLRSREDVSVALIVCDVDNFKRINDLHGHPSGDKVLASVRTAAGRPLPRVHSQHPMEGEYSRSSIVRRFRAREALPTSLALIPRDRDGRARGPGSDLRGAEPVTKVVDVDLADSIFRAALGREELRQRVGQMAHRAGVRMGLGTSRDSISVGSPTVSI